MADRPWALPADIIAYTDYKQVQERNETKLMVDISRAEQYVIAYTNNDFSADKTIPDSVKTAIILLAEAYAYNACADTRSGGRRMKSESFDDYSYSSDDAYINIDDLDVKILLDPYVKVTARNGITMRMRKL
jgi:hypothetical protein